MNSATDDIVYRIKSSRRGTGTMIFNRQLYSRRLTAPSGLRVEPAAGLTPWAGRVLPVIGFALQGGWRAPALGSRYVVSLRWRCLGAFRRHDIP